MGASDTKEYVLTNSEDNTDLATVDGITLEKGKDPQKLTEDQAKRLKEAGLKLKTASDTSDSDESGNSDSGDSSGSEQDDSGDAPASGGPSSLPPVRRNS